MSLYKTPCPADLPPFSGLLETACGGGRIHTGGVPRYVRLRGASLPLLAPEVTQHCSARRRPNRQRRGTESSTSGRWDGLQRFPRAEARAVGIRGGKREGGGGRASFARLRRDRAGAPTLGAHSRYPHSPQVVVVRTLWPKTNKAMSPKLGNIASWRVFPHSV